MIKNASIKYHGINKQEEPFCHTIEKVEVNVNEISIKQKGLKTQKNTLQKNHSKVSNINYEMFKCQEYLSSGILNIL